MFELLEKIICMNTAIFFTFHSEFFLKEKDMPVFNAEKSLKLKLYHENF